MIKVKFPLFTKVIVWFFLNLLLLVFIFVMIFELKIGFEGALPFNDGISNRTESVKRLIEGEVDDKSREERDAILQRFSEAYNVDFFLFDIKGTQMGGKPVTLPDEVFQEITRYKGFGPPPDSLKNANVPRRGPGGMAPAGPPSPASIKTYDPTEYWLAMFAMTFDEGENFPVPTYMIIRSDSATGNGLFFDPWPWIAMAAIVVGVSVLFWLPFVRRITTSVKLMTAAAEKIAAEEFEVRVDEHRTDELGGLGTSINDLAKRLSGFVNGQKRFLGDISHELNSPLARMQFALSILEERVRAENLPHVVDVREEVELMSKLVGELLSYSKSGLQGVTVKLEPIKLRPLIEKAVEREATSDKATVEIAIQNGIAAQGQSELLFRAFSNVVRNGLDYAPKKGTVTVTVKEDGKNVVLTISDDGPGVPEEMLEKIFDPLFRVQDDRSRETGGTGLGLAIVKTCIEACRGHVEARNRKPSGLEVAITLNKPQKIT